MTKYKKPRFNHKTFSCRSFLEVNKPLQIKTFKEKAMASSFMLEATEIIKSSRALEICVLQCVTAV
jgi:hypothetical protein